MNAADLPKELPRDAKGFKQRLHLHLNYGHVLWDVRALREPVPCRGWQGFWTLDATTASLVEEQL